MMVRSWRYRHMLAIRYLWIFLLSFCLISFFTLNVYTASSLEDKIFFSRLRFIGFATLAPAGLLFFSSVLKRWNWLHTYWAWFFLFATSFVTILITLGVFNPDLHVYSHELFEHLGVSVLTFKNGPWFWVHYRVSNIVNVLAVLLLIHSLVVDREKRGRIFVIYLGVLSGSTIDAYCVATNSPMRWLMLSAGTFVITELSIWYVANKYDLFGIAATEKAAKVKLQENIDFQRKTLALIAHDLSGNIHQQAQLAQYLRKNSKDNNNEVLNTWSDSAQASSDLIGNIMRWVKTQGHDFKPQIVPVNINKLLKECIESVCSAFADRGVIINVETPSESYFVKCDQEMMASIIRNLLSNAIKATSDGQKITIKVTEQNSFCRVAVHDEGIGMTEEQLNLFRHNQNIKINGGAGYGFGLYMVSHFVQMHKGKLEIESIFSKGTEIYFSIPL